ncbi:MAG: BCSC C-terminal domain-containing protein, partial [Micrococcales bacterium]|nr:BCSC C-terminal domain-containing protein [Micrococcales bacterium]
MTPSATTEIFLIDDDADLRRATRQTLELAGFPVRDFADARSALQALEVDRSPSLSAGTVYRNRAGESGLSRLTDLQVPVQARIPVGEGKMVVSATPTVLDAGKVSGDYGTRSRFGEGPLAAVVQFSPDVQSLLGVTPGQITPGSQHASGVGLAVGYEGKNLNASVG